MIPALHGLTSFQQLTPAQLRVMLWANQKRIFTSCGISLLVGLLWAFVAPVSYRVDVSIMPELQTRSALNLKRFGALAELAGIDLDAAGGVTEAVRPDLYPNIVSSRPFLLHLLNQPVVTTTHQPYPTLVSLLTSPTRSWINQLVYSAPITMPRSASTGQPLQLNVDQEDLLKEFGELVRSDLDKQSGLILIRVEMPDPNVAAMVSQQAIDYLKQYVTVYRTDKLHQTLTFLTEQRRLAQIRHQEAERQLTRYQDEHRYTVLQTATLPARELEANVTIARTVLDDITRQYEQTQLRIQEETPVFKVLEPPYVPSRRSAPHRKWIILASVIIGVGLQILWLLFTHNSNRKV